MMIVRCPECSGRFKAPERLAGKSVECVKCKATFMVPELEEEMEEIEELEEAPRSKRGSRRDDDDDYEDDDRPARKRRRDDDYEDDEDYERRKARSYANAIQRSRTAMLLLFIGMCLFVGALGLQFLTSLISVLGAQIGQVTYPIAILVGLGHWIVGAVGLGFLVSGPAKYGARGLGIAAAAVGGTHLILLLTQGLQTNEYRLDTAGFVVTQLKYLMAVPMIFQNDRAFGISAVPVLTGMLELALFILIALCIRACAMNVKDHGLAGSGMALVIAVPSVIGGLIVVELIFSLVLRNVGITSRAGFIMFYLVRLLLVDGPFIGLMVYYLIVLNNARDAIYPRKSK